MAGPVTMALGPFMFRAHGFGYSQLGRKLDTTWAELETAGRLNALQWTGPKSEMVTVKGVLFPQEYGGLKTLEGVRLAARNGLPLMMVSLGGLVFGMHAVQGVEDEQEFHNRRGVPGRASYQIQVRRMGSGLSLASLLGGLL